MTFEETTEKAHRKSQEYALQNGRNPVNSTLYSVRYSAYYAGFMENFADRETLRQTAERNHKYRVEFEDMMDAL